MNDLNETLVIAAEELAPTAAAAPTVTAVLSSVQAQSGRQRWTPFRARYLERRNCIRLRRGAVTRLMQEKNTRPLRA